MADNMFNLWGKAVRVEAPISFSDECSEKLANDIESLSEQHFANFMNSVKLLEGRLVVEIDPSY